jgi:serine/threonine protein kinase
MELTSLCMGCMEDRGHGAVCPHCGWVNGTYPESALHLPPGTILVDKYLLGRVLGQGGFGITYLAWDIYLDRKLAVKEFFPRDLCYRETGNIFVSIYSGTESSQYYYGLDKFLDEGKTLAKFDGHPNIVSVRDFFKANDTAYLAMNYLEGATLFHYLSAKGERISYSEALQIIMPVLDALRAVHEAGLLHRDISPDNIMITTKGRVVILDFGAARHAIGEKGKNYSVILKPGYAPEEQYRSNGLQGPWTDLYAVAATIYRSLTGHMPPESLDRLSDDTLIAPSAYGVSIPMAQEGAILKAMAVKAENRYQSVDQFQQALLASADQLDSVTTLQGIEEIASPVSPVLDRANQAQTTSGSGEHAHPVASGGTTPLSSSSRVITIGRASDNDLVLNDSTVSRHHARVFFQDGYWYIEDLNSTHGTFLNGFPVDGRSVLNPASEIGISVIKMHFSGNGLFSENGDCLANFDENQPLSNRVEQFAYNEAGRGADGHSSKRFNKPVLLAIAGFTLLLVIVFIVIISPGDRENRQIAVDDQNLSLETKAEHGTIEFPDGTYTGEIVNGKPEGYGVFIYKQAELSPSTRSPGANRQYEGYWLDGKKHGEGTMTYPEGLTKKGTWENDQLVSN